MKGKRNRGRKGKKENIDFSSGEETSRRRKPLDPNYNRPGDDFGPPKFTPQTSEFTLVDYDYYGFFMWLGGNGTLYLS